MFPQITTSIDNRIRVDTFEVCFDASFLSTRLLRQAQPTPADVTIASHKDGILFSVRYRDSWVCLSVFAFFFLSPVCAVCPELLRAESRESVDVFGHGTAFVPTIFCVFRYRTTLTTKNNNFSWDFHTNLRFFCEKLVIGFVYSCCQMLFHFQVKRVETG